MARLRLIAYGGNYGPLVQGLPAQTALFEVTGPWGLLAWADFHLFAPVTLAPDPKEAERLARAALPWLPGPAMARLYLATKDPAWLAELEKATDRDGLGDALVACGGEIPAGPGTWVLGVGAAGAPGAGFGGAVVFVHPDLALRGWALQAAVAGTSRGSGSALVALRSPGELHGDTAFSASRTVQDRWVDDVAHPFSLDLLTASAGPGWDPGRWSLAVGVDWRWEEVEDLQRWYLGPSGSAAWDRRRERPGAYVGVSGEWAALGSPHLGTTLDLRGYLDFAHGTLAARSWTSQQWAQDAAFTRWPTAGGAEIHRGAWAFRYRSPLISTVDLEQRWKVGGPVGLALFVNGAYVQDDGLHGGAGGGIRFIFPPEDLNVIRLDVAVSDSGWGIYTGYGEAF